MLAKKVVGVAVFGSVVFCLFSGEVFAVNGNMGGGDGSKASPWLIEDLADFHEFTGDSNYWDDFTRLQCDLNLAGVTYTTAVIAPDTTSFYQFQGTSFTGDFEGNGQTIFNLTIDTAGVSYDYLGLFGQIKGSSAEVKNLDLENVNIIGGDDSVCLGGLCGKNEEGTIRNCYTTGSVTGGIGSDRLGSLCGNNSDGTIHNCYVTGSVIGGDDSYHLGDLCGTNSEGTIRNCYATGSVTGGDDSRYLGGLCGENIYGSISNCYATGSVTGRDNSHRLGGLCGWNTGGSISNCYFLDTAGPDNGAGQPLDDPNMRIQSSFVGWDFVGETANGTSSTWIIHVGEYPSLFYFDPTFVPYEFVGQGTEQDPYLIGDPNDLGAIYQQPECHYRLQNNIDLAGINWSVAIIPDFAGIFDGNGRIISNLTIDNAEVGSDYLGLFGSIEGTNAQVKNLGLINVTIIGGDGSDYLGGLCGRNDDSSISNCYARGNIISGNECYYLGGLCGDNRGDINNCYSTGSVSGGIYSRYLGGLCGSNYTGINIINSYSTSSVTGGDDSECLGGLCGRNYYGSISQCYSTGLVTGNGCLGGLCGYNYSGTITNCYATGLVIHEDYFSWNFGGLCGWNSGNISNSYAFGPVAAWDFSERLGGLCGWNSGYISNSYASGPVTAGDNSERLGGLCGASSGNINNCYAIGSVTCLATSDYLGGLCGYTSGNINNCYASGSLTSWSYSGYYGGLCGYNDEAGIGNCYFLDTAGPDNGSGTPLTDSEMKQQSSFVSWDFDPNDGDPADWLMPPMDYPKLYWQPKIAYCGQTSISLGLTDSGTIQIHVYCLIDETLHWVITGHESCAWITGLDPNSGSSSGPADQTTVTLEIDSLDLNTGDYTRELTLAADNGERIAIPVSLNVYKPIGFPELSLLIQYWLMTGCDRTQSCSTADWFMDSNIDMRDFNQLALSWLGQEIIHTGWHDYREDFSSGKPTEIWEYYSSNSSGRIEVVNERLRMDRDIHSGNYTLNEAILHLDLTGQSNLELSFWQATSADEQNALPLMFTGHVNGDGVSVSPDGKHWITVVNAAELNIGVNTAGKTFTVDLDALGLEYTGDFQIKFQQYDDYPWSIDGREWDNIQITKILQ